VYRDDGDLVESGDYSGFGGAALALAQRPDVAVLETARGGILLRGVGVAANDVAVVTNISADHLGLHGVRTLDQLAEVKSTITRITRPDGWDVLNADDPRVLAMRRGATGRTWLCSLDADHPAIREVLAEGGRATVPLDGRITVLERDRADALVPLVDVPVTIAGVSSHHVMNAMQAAAAGLAVGLPRAAVVRGLRSFVLDPERNPGRANLFSCDGRVVVVDYAARRLELHPARGFRYRGRGDTVAITIKRNRPWLSARLTVPGGTPVERTLLVDTGSEDAVDDSVLLRSAEPLTGSRATGLGAGFSVQLGRFSEVTIGRATFRDVPGVVPAVPIVGAGILHRFHRLVFAYDAGRLYLER
jgi:hypothetical protein